MSVTNRFVPRSHRPGIRGRKVRGRKIRITVPVSTRADNTPVAASRAAASVVENRVVLQASRAARVPPAAPAAAVRAVAILAASRA
jgi:hypothetical protein